MRLLYFINAITNSGGIERIVIDKINYLQESAGYEVALAYYGDSSDKPFFKINSQVSLFSMERKCILDSPFQKIRSYFKVLGWVKRTIDDFKPNIIINANVALVSWILPFARRKIPKIVELHFSYEGMAIITEEMYKNNFFLKKFNFWLRKYGYARYDRCILLTDGDLEKWNFKNTVVIPNFTNINPQEYLPSEKRKVVVNIGRLSPQKNHKLLITAWSIVKKNYPDWSLEIWGSGELKEALTKQIQDLGISEQVKLKGLTNNVEDIYRYSSFFVLSSEYEGLPLVVIEALRSSVPCISFDISGVHGIIMDGENGHVVKEMTPEALADTIIKTIDKREELVDMGRKASLSANRFDKAKVMKLWVELFNTLLIKS